MSLPEPFLAQVMLYLWSELEGRVPQGAYQQFFSERIQEFFSTETRDFSDLRSLPPGALVIRATPSTLDALGRLLSE